MEPSNKGHFGASINPSGSFLYSEVHNSIVWEIEKCPLLRGLLYRVPISEGPLSEVSLYTYFIPVHEMTIAKHYTFLQIYQRNPVCGFQYPCGDFADCSDTCVCGDGNTTDDGSGLLLSMANNATATGLPRGFLVCNQVNTSLWSTLLCICTFLIAVLLRKLRQSRFLGKQVYTIVVKYHYCLLIVSLFFFL